MRIGLALAIVPAALCLLAAGAHADVMAGFTVALCEDLLVLQNPNNKIVSDNAALKSQHTLMLERTMPYVEVRNTSTNGAALTKFNMTIGDTTKNFDWATLISASPGVTFSLVTPDSKAGGAKSDVLTINFSGLDPGDFVRFRMGLSPDDSKANAIMDYRLVMFCMNGGDPNSNSIITANFQGSDGSESLTKQIPCFPNDNQYTSTDLALLTTSCGMDSVVPFSVVQQGVVQQGASVPEPSSVLLMGLGLMGLVGWRLRARRRAP